MSFGARLTGLSATSFDPYSDFPPESYITPPSSPRARIYDDESLQLTPSDQIIEPLSSPPKMEVKKRKKSETLRSCKRSPKLQSLVWSQIDGNTSKPVENPFKRLPPELLYYLLDQLFIECKDIDELSIVLRSFIILALDADDTINTLDDFKAWFLPFSTELKIRLLRRGILSFSDLNISYTDSLKNFLSQSLRKDQLVGYCFKRLDLETVSFDEDHLGEILSLVPRIEELVVRLRGNEGLDVLSKTKIKSLDLKGPRFLHRSLFKLPVRSLELYTHHAKNDEETFEDLLRGLCESEPIKSTLKELQIISDPDLRHLGEITKRHLELLEALSLTKLDLSNAIWNFAMGGFEELLEEVVKMTTLRSLHLGDIEFPQNGFPEILSLDLEEFVLNGCTGVSEALLNTLKEMGRLSKLSLVNCKLEDNHLKIIGEMVSLRELILSRNPKVTEVGFGKIKKLNHLENLDVTLCGLSNKAMKELLRMNLSSLNFSSNNLEDSLFSEEGVDLGNVTSLDLVNNILESPVFSSRNLGNLKKLYLSGCSLSNEALEVLADSSLRTLALYECNLTDDSLKILGEGRFKHLFLNNNSQITKEGIINHLAEVHLSSLSLCCTEIDIEGIREIQRALPGCRIDY